LSQGAGAEPLSMHVPAQSLVTLTGESQTRIPTGVPYSLTFSSAGTGIVVSRTVTAPAGSPAGVPEIGDVSAVPGGSKRWLVPAVVAPGSGAWSLAIVDLSTKATKVKILTPSGRAIAGLPVRRVSPTSPLVIGPNPGAPFGTVPFEVSADEPIAVELDLLPVAQAGVVIAPTFAPA
jgi:hypothetical protein